MKKSLKILIIVLAAVLLCGTVIGVSVYSHQVNKDTATITLCLRDSKLNKEEFITIKTRQKFLESALNEAKDKGKIQEVEYSYGFVSKLNFLSNDFANNRSISIFSNLGSAYNDPSVPTPDYVKGEAVYLINVGAALTPIKDGAVYLFLHFYY